MLNSVSITGNLTADPELKQTANGLSVTSFTVAVARPFAREKVTDFFEVVAWKNDAEFVCKYFRKGQMIAISGSLQTREWEDKNGNKRKTTEIVANNVSFCGSKNDNRPETVTPVFEPDAATPAQDNTTDENDLPF